jgi:hypothetical protein
MVDSSKLNEPKFPITVDESLLYSDENLKRNYEELFIKNA